MTTQSFVEKLSETIDHHQSLLCVGLDPNPNKYPDHFPATIDATALVDWGKKIITQTEDLVCCYKPNIAFYEQFGIVGMEALHQTLAAIPEYIPVLLDAKRGDIGSTAEAYARAAFEVWQADAITVNPYMGRDSITPFLAYPGKMVFLLGYTSNPSAREIQEFGSHGERLFEHVIRQGQTWGTSDQIGFVVGATHPYALDRFRRLNPSAFYWILAPGIGAQGGDLSTTLTAGLDRQGRGVIIPVSRGIIYADNPRQATLTLRDKINQARHPSIKPQKTMPILHIELIRQLYDLGCIQFGDFTLASGQNSPIYIDLRLITADSTVLQMVARSYIKLLTYLKFDHLAAVPYAALTLGTAISLTMGKPLIYPRKEAKAYGKGKKIEGSYSKGDRAVIIEDLVTSGGSVLQALEKLQAEALIVSDVVVLIDREQGGQERLAQEGCRLHKVFNLTEVVNTLYQIGKISGEQLTRVKNYLKESH